MSSRKDKVVNKIDKVFERVTLDVSENPTFNFAISSVPIFGPVIQNIISNLEPEITKNRILELFILLRKEVLSIDQVKIDQTYFDTEEFYDLFRKVLEYTVRTRDRKKIALYAMELGLYLYLPCSALILNDWLLLIIFSSITAFTRTRRIDNRQKHIFSTFVISDASITKRSSFSAYIIKTDSTNVGCNCLLT